MQWAWFVVVNIVGGGGGVVLASSGGLVIVCDHGGMRGGRIRRRRCRQRHGESKGVMVPRMGVFSMALMQDGSLLGCLKPK